MSRNFMEMLRVRWGQGLFACVGLDSALAKIPEAARQSGNETDFDVANTMTHFNKQIVNATRSTVCAFKPNMAFYRAQGLSGANALFRTTHHILSLPEQVPVIIDAKDADVDNTNEGYVEDVFDHLCADAVTVHPYLGGKALKPFLDRADKGIIVLCRTSNKGAGEFQDRSVAITDEEAEKWDLPQGTTMPMYQLVAYRVSREWNTAGNCALVVGATYPDELREVRRIVGNMPILIPGIGAQGGDLEKTVSAGKDSNNAGMIVNSSRGIIFASSGEDYAEAAARETDKLSKDIRTALAA